MNTKKPRVLIIGSIFMDQVWEGVPKLAEYGESLSCTSYSYVPGGKGANQAVSAAHMGLDAVMIGRLGDDNNGHILYDTLAASGVTLTHVPVDPAVQTGMALMLIDAATGKYTSYHVMGGNDIITKDQVKSALSDGHYDMILINLEMPLETVFFTCETAAKKNIPVFLDAGPAMQIPLDRLKGLFVLSPNESETKALTGISPDNEENVKKAASCLYENAAPGYVLLKLGNRGAYLYDGKDGQYFPAFPANAIDSTAAGDTFGGAFAAAYCQGKSIRESVIFANAAASICVSRKGGQPSIPLRKEVEAFLAEHGIA